MKVKVAFAALLICGAALPVGAGETNPITMRVSPAIAFAPANLIVRATVQAHESNRAIEIVAESDSFYRSSEIQLEGDHAPGRRITNLSLTDVHQIFTIQIAYSRKHGRADQVGRGWRPVRALWLWLRCQGPDQQD